MNKYQMFEIGLSFLFFVVVLALVVALIVKVVVNG